MESNEKIKVQGQVTYATTGSHPPAKQDSSIRITCLISLVAGAILYALCFLYGFISLAQNRKHRVISINRADLSSTTTEVLAFLINLALTQCIESFAYIHSLSLRWALVQEDKLEFNINIRLFRNSKKSRPNSWLSNVISGVCLILCYAGTSQLFLQVQGAIPGRYIEIVYVNLIALFAVGLGILGQWIIALWCYVANVKEVASWTSNPLNTTLSAWHDGKF
jgi:hypothetical protein